MEKMPKLTRDFWRFHRDNPQVLQDLLKMAGQLRDAGQRHWGMKSLFEVMRWQVALKTRSDDGFKLNNNYTAFYSRLIEKLDPRFVSFFNERQSEADEMFDWLEDR